MEQRARWLQKQWSYCGQNSEISQGSEVVVIIDQTFPEKQGSVVKVSIRIGQNHYFFEWQISQVDNETEYDLIGRVLLFFDSLEVMFKAIIEEFQFFYSENI